MKYAGMPWGMWMLFAPSFRKQLTAVFGYGTDRAKTVTKKAKLFAHLCKRAGEALKLAVISPERRRLQSLLAPETGTDAQRVYLFRGCAGDSRKAA